LRLDRYDYSQAGAYFITICTYGRAPLLAAIRDGSAHLTAAGSIVEEEWLRTPRMRPNVVLDEHVILPNHIHGILFILEGEDAEHSTSETLPYLFGDPSSTVKPPDTSHTIGSVVHGFKSATTSRIRRLRATQAPARPLRVWQRQFFDHVIRDDADLNRIREYISTNPLRWELDRFFIRDPM
jgi:REP element-mobilizing transposase RayT